MPIFSGMFTSRNQLQARGDNVWPVVPDAPTIGSATATGSTTATVAFTQPGNDGGSTILSYTATSSPGGITGTLSQAGSGTINMTGLSQGTSYTFTVTATNAIGTSSPSANLEVVRSSTGTVASFGINGQTINPRLRIDADESNNTVTLNPNYSGSTSPALVFKTQEAERMRILASGNVGIGTTSPSEALSVNGNIILTGTANRYIRIQSASNYYYNLQSVGDDFHIVEAGSTPRFVIKYPSGNVGIGTTTPQAKLSVTGASSAFNDIGIFQVTSGTGAVANLKLTFGVNDSGYTWIQSVLPGTDLRPFAISPQGGNVWIGAAAAFSNNTKLQVTGDICVSSGSRMYFDSSAATLSIKSSSSGAGGDMEFYAGGTASSNIAMKIASDETVAIYNVFNRQTASYTLVLGDAGRIVEMNVGTANNLTVPLNSSVAFVIGTEIVISQYGAGQTTIVATSGVTLRSKSGQLKIGNQYTAVTLVKVGTDEWYVWGNVSA